MAVRRFLKQTGSGDLQRLTAAEMDNHVSLAVRAFALNPPVSLARVSSGGNMGTYTDTYTSPGRAVSTSSSFKSAANTPNIRTVTNTNWGDHLKSTTDGVSTPTDVDDITYPVYYDSDQNAIIACSLADMVDTIYGPAVTLLTQSSEDYTKVGGTFAIYKDGEEPSNTTQQSSNPVFRDTTNTKSYTREGLPYGTTNEEAEAEVTVTTQENWYLYRFDTPPRPSTVVSPLTIGSATGGTLQTISTTSVETLYTEGMRHTTTNETGHTLNYAVGDGISGTTKGQSMDDTRLTSSTYYQDQDGDTYYTQEVPTGSTSTEQSFTLKLQTS